jgi:chromosome segregation ATPase
MSGQINRWGVAGACVVALLAASRLPVAGQDARNREDVLQALLTEVRGLRLAIEQMTTAAPRVQLVMGRLQIQEQRLNASRRRLDDVRDGIAAAERESADARDRMAMMEETLPRVADPAERDSISVQMKMTKAGMAQKAADIQRLREQEAELTGVVASEESRWTDISQRLDELERSLSPRRSWRSSCRCRPRCVG